jgi:hypothetical protein
MPAKRSPALRTMNVVTLQSSDAEAKYRIRAGASMTSRRALAPGLHATPDQDLVFGGGRTLPSLGYTNFFVGGQASWKASDVRNIDRALAAAMNDRGLNNVLAQYFRMMPTTEYLGSHVVRGARPAHVSQGDIEQRVAQMYAAGSFDSFDLASTVFNFMLPRGTVLNDNPVVGARAGKKPLRHAGNVESEASDSLHGLGGYHGSIQRSRTAIYYAVGVYSEHTASGDHGIPAFDRPWKSVVATFYHELCEARTDPDVEDANRRSGWTSSEGEEIGDFPIFESSPLSLVFQEVPLSNRNGTVPVQFMYSNRVHGPEGPRASRYPFHSAASRPRKRVARRTRRTNR